MLVALAGLWYLLFFACSIASFVFFILVLVQMFKRDQTNLGIICIVLGLCSGVGGPLVAFVYGWMKATEWNIKKTMTYWTVAFVLQFVFVALIFATAVGAVATMDPGQFNADPNEMNFEFPTEGTELPEEAAPGEPTTDEVPQPEASPTDQP